MKHAGRTFVTELRRGNYKYEETETETAFDGLHSNIHNALEAFDDLPTKVKVIIIEDLDDTLLTVIGSD
ncbi:hypothetical protein [Haladaptatus halobius]|uniref:hypothetical protein n=1 Tax=Haladaptatus halobius TaxID=2884875 RepID=UPI001D0BA445|nr:hypothetical protein [Haladaptatus halobius]